MSGANQDPQRARTPWQPASQCSYDEGRFELLQLHSDFSPEQGYGLCHATVQVFPINSVKHYSIERHGLLPESILAPAGSGIEFGFDASVPVLVMYDEGTRCDGETSVDELELSRLRHFADKMTFVPVGYSDPPLAISHRKSVPRVGAVIRTKRSPRCAVARSARSKPRKSRAKQDLDFFR